MRKARLFNIEMLKQGLVAQMIEYHLPTDKCATTSQLRELLTIGKVASFHAPIHTI
jgi:hypothetical protein